MLENTAGGERLGFLVLAPPPPEFRQRPQVGPLLGRFLVSFVGISVAPPPRRVLTQHHLQRDLDVSEGWGEDCPMHALQDT